MELDPARTELLIGFFETYLKLNQDEAHTLEAEFQNSNEMEANVMEIISSYRKEGRLEGRIEGKRDSIFTIFETKFDFSSQNLQEKLRTIDDLEVLEKLLKKIVVADSLQEAENVLESAMNKH